MRKLMIAGAGLAALLGASQAATAEETTVIRRDSAPSVSVERREGVVDRTVTTTRDTGCESKTVHKENDLGESKTVHKERC